MESSNDFKKLKAEKLISKSDSSGYTTEHKEDKHKMGDTAKRKLITVCVVCTIFMVIEFVGGVLANSVAIMTDAAHLLSDLSGFIISIVALYLAKFPSDKNFSYGYYRAETIGALLSVFIIWILTVLLLSESLQKLFDNHHMVDGGIMLFTSSVGLIFNVIMAYILHSSEDGCHHNHTHADLGTLLIPQHETVKITHHDHSGCDRKHKRKCDSDSDCSSSPARGKNTKFIEMEEVKCVKKISEENFDNVEEVESSEGEMAENKVNEKLRERGKDIHNHSCEDDHDHTHGNDHDHKGHTHNPNLIVNHMHKHEENHTYPHKHKKEIENDNYNHLNNISALKPSSCTQIGLGNKNRSVNMKNFTYSSYKSNFVDRSDFSTSPTQRRSQRGSQRENYIMSDSPCSHSNSKTHHHTAREMFTKDYKESRSQTNSQTHKNKHNHKHSKQGHSHRHSHGHRHSDHQRDNINIQAAMIHIIGDIIQSIGVIIAAIIVYVFPKFQVVDPLITIFFSIIVIFTTVPIIKQCFTVIMEATPAEWDLDEIKKTISEVQGVESVLCIHAYSLAIDKNVLNAKILSKHRYSQERLLSDLHYQLRDYEIYHLNIEIQKHNEVYTGNCEYSDDIL